MGLQLSALDCQHVAAAWPTNSSPASHGSSNLPVPAAQRVVCKQVNVPFLWSGDSRTVGRCCCPSKRGFAANDEVADDDLQMTLLEDTAGPLPISPKSRQVPILIHFDVNKTIIRSDSTTLGTIEGGIREDVAELFWGCTSSHGGDTTWNWVGGAPSLNPPSVTLPGDTLVTYRDYCTMKFQEVTKANDAIRSFNLVAGQPVKKRMEMLVRLALRKMQLPSELCLVQCAEAAGVRDRGQPQQISTSLFKFVLALQRSGRGFAVLFRSFEKVHEGIKAEWNAFCELRHPICSLLTIDTGPMDGSVPGIPDRRLYDTHTIYRDADGPMLILETFTTGPADATWDQWFHTQPELDTRRGREYIKEVLQAETVEGIHAIQIWMRNHLAHQASAAIKDDCAWWKFRKEDSTAGKLLPLFEDAVAARQIFFDDSIDRVNPTTHMSIDCRDPKGVVVSTSRSLCRYCFKVNSVEAILYGEYFIRKMLQADHAAEYELSRQDPCFCCITSDACASICAV